MWMLTVESYSYRSLTGEKDKLPAIAGMASIIQGLTGSDYVAGLWQDNMVMSLTCRFRILGFEGLETLPCALEGHVAPTVSWASFSGGLNYATRVRMHPLKWIPECEVIDY